MKTVQGLVVGTRKAGTTWLYENMLEDPHFSLSAKVKESGYFTGDTGLTADAYSDLFSRGGGQRVEIDTSVCYEDTAQDNILQYNEDMKIVVIFREPGEWLRLSLIHI